MNDETMGPPIPTCNHILPRNLSVWNSVTDASDTMPKLMWTHRVRFSKVGGSQLVASVTFTQLHQMNVMVQTVIPKTWKQPMKCFGQMLCATIDQK